MVEAARGEPVRKSLGISFGKSFSNYHPVYNDYFIPFKDYFREKGEFPYISSMILDWPRHWRRSYHFNKYSLIDCIKKMNRNPEFSEYYDNTIKIVEFSKAHEKWYEEIDRDRIMNISDYYKKTNEWFRSVYNFTTRLYRVEFNRIYSSVKKNDSSEDKYISLDKVIVLLDYLLN